MSSAKDQSNILSQPAPSDDTDFRNKRSTAWTIFVPHLACNRVAKSDFKFDGKVVFLKGVVHGIESTQQ
jgi:hypothetical protein